MTTMTDIAAEASKLFGVHIRDMRGSDRHDWLLPSRYALCLALRRRGYEYQRIGRWMGGRDHTTIINACSRATDKEANDPDYAAKVRYLVDFRIPPIDPSVIERLQTSKL